jgi:phenylalanyl-tRNA synthetase beta chain
MKVSREWLADFVELEGLTDARLAEVLTLSGTEVERTVPFGQGLEQLVVGEVVEVGHLAGSDHLSLARVRVPGAEPVDVVCGAPNLFPGALVPWARPGTTLPTGMEIGARKIMGTQSQGMLCAPDELALGTEHAGVMILAREDSEPGQPLSTLFPLDTIFELEVLSNRADCLSHWGVARELAAGLGRQLQDPDTRPLEARSPASVAVSVDIANPQLCPVYYAQGFAGVGRHQAPWWLRRRLQAVGQRSLSGLVDLANYVMLEVGQPLHTFDLDRLPRQGPAVALGVRTARDGERLACLDGVERVLEPRTLVITSADQPVAIAGVIGGSASAVEEATGEILLEAASFAWTSVRATSRRLGLRTEASSRFERVLSAQLVPIGAARFARLLGDCLGGAPMPGPVVAGELPSRPAPIGTSSSEISDILGLVLTAEVAAGALRRLQFEVAVEGDKLTATPPPIRTDVRLTVDLAEEVGRLIGYDQVPGTLPPLRQPPPPQSALTPVARMVAELAMGAGFNECITGSLSSLERSWAVLGLGEGRSGIAVENALSSQLGALRISLLPGLLSSAQMNQSRGRERVQLFEQGRAFWPGPEGRPEEPELLAMVDKGLDDGVDASAGRLRYLLQVCQALGDRLSLHQAEFGQAVQRGFHPGRCAEIWSDGTRIGVVGELSRAAAEQFELRGRVVAAELRTDGWLVPGGCPSHAIALPRTPALVVDLAVSVGERAQLGPALASVEGAQLPQLEAIRLLDEYQGGQIRAGFKGWTFRLWLRDPARTLTHKDGEGLRNKVLEALRDSVGAEVR